jgi:hypothetical protein
MDVATGTIQIQLARRKEAGPVTAKLAEREKKEPGRNIDYTVVKPDFFVLSGLQGLKKFYLRGTFKGDEVRILTILYDQATENTVEPVVIAMSSAFNAFPAARKSRAAAAQDRGIRHRRRRQRRRRDHRRPPDHRRLPHGCDRGLWQCRSRRRGQGARSRAAAHLWRARTESAQSRQRRRKTALDLTGIADPQNQGGGAAVTASRLRSPSSAAAAMSRCRPRRRSASPARRRSMATASSPASRC